jgi:hypothetical protein
MKISQLAKENVPKEYNIDHIARKNNLHCPNPNTWRLLKNHFHIHPVNYQYAAQTEDLLMLGQKSSRGSSHLGYK